MAENEQTQKPNQTVPAVPSSPTPAGAKKGGGKKLLIGIVFVLAMAVAVGGYFFTTQKTKNITNPNEPAEIVIGYDGDMTTPGTGPSGISGMWTFQIAVDEINAKGGILGKKIKPVILDDKADKEISKKNIEQLIFQDKAVAIIAPSNSANGLYWLNIPQDNGVTVISAMATASELTAHYKDRPRNYIFKEVGSNIEESRLLVPWVLKKTNNGKIAIIHDNAGYGVQGLKDVTEVLTRWGKTPVIVKGYNLGTSVEDLTAIIQAAKNAGADALMLYAYADSNANVLKALDQVKGYNPLVVSGTSSEVPTIWKQAGTLASKMVFPVEATIDLNQKVTELNKKVIAKFGQSPYSWNVAATGYDAVQLLAAAIQKAGTLDKTAIRDSLENVENVQGIIKLYKKPFSKDNHEAITAKDLYLAHWVDGKLLKLGEDVSGLEIR